MNIFMARHFDYKYKFKTQCSPEYPFERKVGGGGKVSFTDPQELCRYLSKSEESMYMWTDSEDLAVLSDMYQIKIQIITNRGPNKEPTINWIYPDTDMAKHASMTAKLKREDLILYMKKTAILT